MRDRIQLQSFAWEMRLRAPSGASPPSLRRRAQFAFVLLGCDAALRLSPVAPRVRCSRATRLSARSDRASKLRGRATCALQRVVPVRGLDISRARAFRDPRSHAATMRGRRFLRARDAVIRYRCSRFPIMASRSWRLIAGACVHW